MTPPATRRRRAIVSLGSNVGPARWVPWAQARLRARFDEVRFSPAYASPAVGPPGQPAFVNLVAGVSTDLPRDALRAVLRHLEALAGRTRGADRFAPRTLDLDVIHLDGPHGEEHLEAGDLALAHVLVPWSDLEPDRVLADEERTLAQRAAGLRAGLAPWTVADGPASPGASA